MNNFYIIVSACAVLCTSNASAMVSTTARRGAQQAQQVARQYWAKPAQQRGFFTGRTAARQAVTEGAAAGETAAAQGAAGGAAGAAASTASGAAAGGAATAEAATAKGWRSWFAWPKSNTTGAAKQAAEPVAKPSMVTRAKVRAKQAATIGAATGIGTAGYKVGTLVERNRGAADNEPTAIAEAPVPMEREPVGLAFILKETPAERKERITRQFLLRDQERAWEIKQIDKEIEKNALEVKQLIQHQQNLQLQADQQFQSQYQRIHVLEDENRRELEKLGPEPIGGMAHLGYQMKKSSYSANRATRLREIHGLNEEIERGKIQLTHNAMVAIERDFDRLQKADRDLRIIKKRLDDMHIFSGHIKSEREKLTPEMIDALEVYNRSGHMRPELREAVAEYVEQESKTYANQAWEYGSNLLEQGKKSLGY